MIKLRIVILFSLLLAALPAFAELRAWRSADGNRSFRAEFVSSDGGSVTLKREDRRIVKVPIEKLHADDRAWVLAQRKAMEEKAVEETQRDTAFDTLNFGDSRKVVGEKLKQSKRVSKTLNDTLLGRTGLNGIYSTTIEGVPFQLFFRWSESGALLEVTLRSKLFGQAEYDSTLKEAWSGLATMLGDVHGEPIQAASFPSLDTLQDGALLGTHLWHTAKKHSILLCNGREGTAVVVAIRFAAELIPANKLSMPEQGDPDSGKSGIGFQIAGGKKSELGFISHAVECPTYFKPHGQVTASFEILTPGTRDPDKRYPVVYALAPVASHNVKDDRARLGPLMEIKEEGLHNKHQVICIKVMAASPEMNWKYLQDVVVPYVDRNYPTIAEPRGRLLLGLGKSGAEAWKLLVANPAIFGKACSWDGLPQWPDLAPHVEALRTGPPRLILMGSTESAMLQLAEFQGKLTEEKIPHLHELKLREKHSWSSGWIAGAMDLLFKGGG